MRFAADGPIIPNELIEARDRGEVIFFCGAGVSIPAGLPSFYALTQQILSDLGVPADAAGRRIFRRAIEEQDPDLRPPMDQVIGQLQSEYGNAQVERSVCKQLKIKSDTNLKFHKTLLSLSSGPSGKHRLVTTNFDRLFEKAKPRIKYHVPPFLPDLAAGNELEGIIYLHGRLQANFPTFSSVNLILGASDYGRAYLAEGWALNFLRELFLRYTVVLVGYSADDPPVNYLLRGLHTIDKPRQRRIYAFAAGQAGEADVRWWDRGVQVITYAQSDADHSALWNTLDAWATRAENSDLWRDALIAKAKISGPRGLTDFERGQVAAMVSTFQGAQSFFLSSPPPTSEWLCVFDANIRYAKPQKAIWPSEEEVEFDRLAAYGLDDDPPREQAKPDGKQQKVGIDVLSPNNLDERDNSLRPLVGRYATWPATVPRRLGIIAEWLRIVAHEPVTAWWAAGTGGLHPVLRRAFRHSLRQTPSQMDPTIKKLWRLLLEVKIDAQSRNDEDWYELLSDIRNTGWTTSALAEFSRLVLPNLSAKRPDYRGSRPPGNELNNNLRLSELAYFSLEYRTSRNEITNVPHQVLPQLVAALRTGLIRASNLLSDIEESYLRTTTLHTEDLSGQVILHGGNAYFRWFFDYFKVLCDIDIGQAKFEFSTWPSDERYFFDKLRIWAWSRSDLASSADVITQLMALSKESLWETNHCREVLWAIRSRWTEFSDIERGSIINRILEGPVFNIDLNGEEREPRYDRRVAIWLGWLIFNGCDLPEFAADEYNRLRSKVDGWQESWATTADQSMDSRSGWVRSNEDATFLTSLPVSEIADAAKNVERRPAFGFVENNPFRGLVKSHTRLAVLVLSYEIRARRVSVDLWRTLLSDWPDNVASRSLLLAAYRFVQISPEQIVEMRHESSRWTHKILSMIMSQNETFGWKVWDTVFEALIAAGQPAFASGMGETTVGGVVQLRSRRTVNHAINSPIGELTSAIIDLMIDRAPRERSGIPEPMKQRFQRLLSTSGIGSDFTIVLLCQRLDWLNWIDPDWTKHNLIPLFRINSRDAEPAWNGFLSENRLPSMALFRTLKPDFLAAFEKITSWNWDDSLARSLASFLISAIFSVKRANSLITYEEARNALRIGDDEARATALWLVGMDTKNASRFLSKVWPKEKRYQTANTSERMASLAINSGNSFPRIGNIILEFLVPSEKLASVIFGLTNSSGHDEQSLYKRFPKEAIRLLNALVDGSAPFLPVELSQIVEWVSTSHPILRQDFAWIRLNNIIAVR